MCAVTLRDGRGATSHEVTVSPTELALYAPSDMDPARLVRDAFSFLLAREPRESILRQFRISEIERYFPEFRRMIRP